MAEGGTRLAPFNPSHEDAIALALDALQLTGDDTLVDLGAGNGVLCAAALASTPVRFVFGVEYDAALAASAARAVGAFPGRGEVLCRDVTDASVWCLHPRPTAVYCYLVPSGLAIIQARLLEVLLEQDVRIVTNMFSIAAWAADARIAHTVQRTRHGLAVHYYARADGAHAHAHAHAPISTDALRSSAKACAASPADADTRAADAASYAAAPPSLLPSSSSES
ncbi:hypothetical protein EON68_04140 [archaeon]|nr:MAG: hypothetical protein EON68_04140 [archaeon]